MAPVVVGVDAGPADCAVAGVAGSAACPASLCVAPWPFPPGAAAAATGAPCPNISWYRASIGCTLSGVRLPCCTSCANWLSTVANVRSVSCPEDACRCVNCCARPRNACATPLPPTPAVTDAALPVAAAGGAPSATAWAPSWRAASTAGLAFQAPVTAGCNAAGCCLACADRACGCPALVCWASWV